MFSGRITFAITVAFALAAVSGASGVEIVGYTATGAPSHSKPSTSASYVLALTNTSSTSADRASIGIPLGFGGVSDVTATATCGSPTWTVELPTVEAKINVKRQGGSVGNLCPGGTLTVAFSATSAAVEGSYVWATELFRGEEDQFILDGPQPTVQVDGTEPVVSITSNPADPTNITSASFGFSANEPSSYQCKLDGGSFADCTSPKSYLTDPGTHSFRVKATDLAGNTGPEARYDWRVDTAPPAVTIDQKPSNPTNSREATFVFAAGETATFQCRLDNGAFTPCVSPTSYANLSDGSYAFAVRATDSAGNTGPEASYGWTVDTVPPTATITKAPNDPSGVKTAAFEFSANEPASFLCDLDGGGFAACTSPRVYNNLPLPTDRVHTFKVKAQDPAGNTGAEAAYDWLVETDLPVVTLTATPARASNTSAATFFFTANKSATFECKLDGADFVPCASGQAYSGLPDGSHAFAVRATGTGGTGPPTIYSWTVDTTGPTSAITERPADPTNSRSATFTFSASEPLATFQCKLDDAAFASCTLPQTYGNLGDGRHTFVVRATDALLNVGPETAYAWTIDTRAPAVAVTAGPTGLTNGSTASLSFSADEPSTFQCDLDGRGFEPCSSPAAYGGLSDGGHAFAVRATDAAGNVGAASHSWSVDATAPQTMLDSKPAARTTTTSARFTFSASEPATFQCRLGAGSFSPCGSPKTYSGLARGLHRFSVRAIDPAGNVDATPAAFGWTVGRRITRTVATSALLAPASGARVTRPPLLRWRAISRATYYNVQLYRAGRKVLSAWPTRTRLQLGARWTFNKRVQRLSPGVYRWYVWPGLGKASARRYGRLLGTSAFVVVRAARRR